MLPSVARIHRYTFSNNHVTSAAATGLLPMPVTVSSNHKSITAHVNIFCCLKRKKKEKEKKNKKTKKKIEGTDIKSSGDIYIYQYSSMLDSCVVQQQQKKREKEKK